MARPEVELDLDQVKSLARLGCTVEEMAVVLKCSAKTLQRRAKPSIEEGRLEARASLRKWQWDAAKKGSPAMLIWLGKQELGQRDKQVLTGEDGGPIKHEHGVEKLSDAELDNRIAKLQGALQGQPESLRAEAGTSSAAAGEGQTLGA